MKADRVFIAFLKNDCKEHLLYKKCENLYIDLKTKVRYTIKDIDCNTLIYLKDSIYFCSDNISKRNAKKIYTEDRNELLDIDLFYVVNLKQVLNLEKKFIGTNDLCLFRWTSNDLYKVILKRNCTGSYSDIRINKLYIEPNEYIFDKGTIYVDEKNQEDVIPLSQVLKYYGKIEKIKLLNLSYKLRKNEVK